MEKYYIGIAIFVVLDILITMLFGVKIGQDLIILKRDNNFFKQQNLKIMSLQDDILAKIAAIKADIAAGATDAGTIATTLAGIRAQLATLLANAGVDGTAILAALDDLQGSADTLKSNLDTIAAPAADPAQPAAPAQPADPNAGGDTNSGSTSQATS